MADDDATARRTTKATTGSAAGKAAAGKAAARKAAAKQAGARNAAGAAPVKKAVRKATTEPRKTVAKKAVARKAPARSTTTRATGAVLAPREKAPPRLRLAAEETFDDDWQQPEPEPVREDPSARMRAVLRAAARSLEEKEAGRQPSRPAPVPPRADEPVTRVLVAPEPQTAEEWLLDEDELAGDEDTQVEDEQFEDEVLIEEHVLDEEHGLDEEVDAEVEDEWAPPDQLDDTRSFSPLPQPVPPSAQPPPPPPPIHRATQTEVAASPARPDAPADKTGRKRRRPILLVVLALVGLLAVAGAIWFLVLRDNGIDYSELKVGDCFDSSQSTEIRSIKVEPCSEPHNSEIFFLVTHPAGPDEPYPGKDALVQFAADACLGQPLTDYLGVPLEQSQLKDFEIVPQESAWDDDGRRVLVCGVDTGGQPDVTGSVKGTRR